MELLVGLDATVIIDDVYIADDTEEEHPEKLQLKQIPIWAISGELTGNPVIHPLLSVSYREKLKQIWPPSSGKVLQKTLCSYVRDHVTNYQKYAKFLYGCLKKRDEDKEDNSKNWVGQQWTKATPKGWRRWYKRWWDPEEPHNYKLG